MEKAKEPKPGQRGWVKKRKEKKLTEFYKPIFLRIGVVTHFYDKLRVAVVKIDGSMVDLLRNGDHIWIHGTKTSFGQLVRSMQINHHEAHTCYKDDEVGIKVKHPVKKNDVVYVEQNLYRLPTYAQRVITEQLTIDAIGMRKVKRVIQKLRKEIKRLLNITNY